MNFRLKIHPQAHLENVEAYQWYEVQVPGLGMRYLNAVETTINKICDNPEHFSMLNKKYRHARVPGFPFSIIFEISESNNIIYILAIYHASRDPQKKFRKKE